MATVVSSPVRRHQEETLFTVFQTERTKRGHLTLETGRWVWSMANIWML